MDSNTKSDKQLNQQLGKLFKASYFVKKRLPNEAKREALLAQLIKQPESKKHKFIAILQGFENTLDERLTEKAKSLMATKYKMKRIKTKADLIFQRIEMEEDQRDENDLINKLNS